MNQVALQPLSEGVWFFLTRDAKVRLLLRERASFPREDSISFGCGFFGLSQKEKFVPEGVWGRSESPQQSVLLFIIQHIALSVVKPQQGFVRVGYVRFPSM